MFKLLEVKRMQLLTSEQWMTYYLLRRIGTRTVYGGGSCAVAHEGAPEGACASLGALLAIAGAQIAVLKKFTCAMWTRPQHVMHAHPSWH